ncbi:DNA polymerase V subunit UmuC [Idiomarina sp. OT37-5b]|uniref:translesion error-prone DNA polymerase V subunit UmuC n=1 Tax=Idiomarina sp. OT37-5b TaxID=2100422 RepID=UPI000CF91139|nr:translesion error-prone DNA polymerase V subunit UmuC [Idiomarina sp. OT37-5b]AVJ55842.1 DNA polymerase V subunit UmuC [Idiomarina sp. OT37-5b]
MLSIASAKPAPCFALIDCNNFYVSCERLFRPDLRQRPVLVASNNDGCAVARSAEAKALGIKMGTPLFKIDDLIKQHNIEVFSSNYALYADISNRVMSTIEAMVPRLEIYSIDEAFADLTGLGRSVSLDAFGHQLRNRIGAWVGIPSCVGIAPTKTLAKLANYGAKKYPQTGGVVDLSQPQRQRKLLAITPVDEVWGVGRRISERLQRMGINTALQLAEADLKTLRKQFSVVLERTARELRGESCLAMETLPASKKQIVVSRSFGTPVLALEQIQAALASFVVRAAEKLRYERHSARQLTVFMRTNPFKPQQPQYSNSTTHTLAQPTQDSRELLALTRSLSERIFRAGYHYNKAGVMLGDFYQPGVFQASLFETNEPKPKSRALMNVLDKVNGRKTGALYFASQKTSSAWHMKRERLSPAYTTRWAEIPRVK